MASALTPKIVEVLAVMQAKALAFDSEHPGHPLGTCSAGEYAKAIQALVPAGEQVLMGQQMLAAGAQAMRLLLLTYAETRRAM